MEDFIFLLVCFILVYLVYYVLIINNKKKLSKYRNSTEVIFLENRYKINIKKIEMKKLANIMAISNAFIISVTVLLIGFISNLVLKLIVGLIILIPLILIVYHFVGKSLIKKYGEKE